MTSDIAYAPFGEAYGSTATSGVSFTGMRSDVQAVSGNITSGFYDFLVRELPPTQGRWLSPDPAGGGAVDPSDPQTWNRYAYVRNSPLNTIDPEGLDGWDDWGGFGGGFGWGDFCGDFMACSGAGGGAILPGLLPPGFNPNQGIDWATLLFGPMCSTVESCTMNAVGAQAYKDCINDFYNSKEGQAVSFLSPISLIPGWNPQAWGSIKSWGETLLTKGAIFGSTYSHATQEIVTLNAARNVAAPLEATTIKLTSKISPWAMGTAALADIGNHYGCVSQAFPGINLGGGTLTLRKVAGGTLS